MVPEQPLEASEHGLIAGSEGWFVLNAAEARWRERPGRGCYCDFEGDSDFAQIGINVQTLAPGEPMAMYHWEADQEDFLVLAGEGVLVIEGQERPLRRWDFVHCPAGTEHVIVAAGSGPLVVLCIGARGESTGPNWGAYTVDAAARRHGAGVDQETTDERIAYARFPAPRYTSYRPGLLPD
ncbi:MAG: cupin domain-containing protein [Gaiellales bacterium]|jgi:uncharacterized cupin superfamily protein